jgi:hypothetical protein
MRKAIMITGLVLALGVLVPVTALGKPGGTDRPVHGNGSGTTVVDLGTLAFALDSTSVVSHVGQSTLHIDGVITPTGPSTFTVAGPLTLTAANGDQLFGDFSGSGTGFGGSTGTTATTITGGTGRFTGASGSVSGPFTQTPISTDGVTNTFATTFSLSGTISY